MSNLAVENLALGAISEKLKLAAISPAKSRTPLPPETSEESLTRRFSHPALQQEPVSYGLTRDAGFLHQYRLLCEQMLMGGEDEDGPNSEVMVARIGSHCIAGCRLTFSYPHDRHFLPMEKDGFVLAKALPGLPMEDCVYVEMSRLAILPEFQNGPVMIEFFRQLFKRATTQQARYAFALTPAPLARDYRKAAHLFGLKWDILSSVSVPEREEYDGRRMALSVLDLTPVYRSKAKPKREAALAAAV